MVEDLFNCLGEKERENGEKTVRGLCCVRLRWQGVVADSCEEARQVG